MEKLLTIAPQVVLEKKNILNGEEKRYIYEILNTKEYQISSQVSMSAFVNKDKSKNKDLATQCWYLHNKLYIDFLIVEQE